MKPAKKFSIPRMHKIMLVAAVAVGGLGLTAMRSDAARVVIRVGPRPYVCRKVVVRPALHRVWKPGHWEYRPARDRYVWISGRWIWVR